MMIDDALAARLDNPVWYALVGPHARYRVDAGEVDSTYAYHHDYAMFAATSDPAATGLPYAASLLSSARPATCTFLPFEISVPPGCTQVYLGHYTQMICAPGMSHPPTASVVDEVLVLGGEDEPEMAALVERTEPGPWAPRTQELGLYLGVRDPGSGALVAMAGQRMRLDGATEVSSVCTDPSARARGHARRLVGLLTDEIHRRGDIAFLHVRTDNTSAIAAYEAVGYIARTVLTIQAFIATRDRDR